MRRMVLAGLLMGSSVVAAHAAVVDGTWKITGSVADNAVASTCVIAEKTGVLTGTCTGTDAKVVPITGGTYKDGTLTWSYTTTYNGGDIVLTYTAKMDKDGKLAGTIYVDPYAASGDFTATK